MAVSESVSRPAPFVEALGTLYSRELPKLTGTPIDTSQFAPTVATYDAFQQAGLQNIARQAGLGSVTFDPKTGAPTSVGAGTGIAGYEPYLKQAAAYSGPQAYQQFMSPYQQDVINASLGEYDKQAAKGMSGIGQMAAKSGNLGGGREGVMRSEYKSNSDMNRALLNAKLLQQGFGQANQLANQAFNQQGQLTQGQQNLFQGQGQLTDQEKSIFAGQGRLTQGEQNLFQGQGQLTDQERNMFTGQGQLFSGQGQLVQGQQNLFNNQQNLMQGANTLGADQQRMAQLMPQLRGSDISTLGQAGRGQQLYNQSVLDQQREANRMAAYEPYERLGYLGAGMGNVMGGGMGQYTSTVTPNQSPLQQAMGIASLGLGAYTGLGGKLPKIF